MRSYATPTATASATPSSTAGGNTVSLSWESPPSGIHRLAVRCFLSYFKEETNGIPGTINHDRRNKIIWLKVFIIYCLKKNCFCSAF